MTNGKMASPIPQLQRDDLELCDLRCRVIFTSADFVFRGDLGRPGYLLRTNKTRGRADGVDYERFSSAVGKPHPELADIPRPIVGFFGGIDDYLVDLDLLERVAKEVRGCSLVLIGDATCPIDDLVTLPNVHRFGFRPYEEIPSFGAGFDVALMPWLRNDWIEHSNPIKLKEYLGLGLPVVSTDFPEVHHYSDVIAIAPEADGFVARVRDAVDGQAVGTMQARQTRVEGATWDRQAKELIDLGEGRTS